MSVLAKYLIREFSKLLIICLLIFIAIYLMIDFASGVDDFIKANSPKSVMFSYFAYKIPSIAVQMLPAATLTTIIIMFSLMKKNNEITSLKACGANIWKISQPVIITALFLSFALFLFSEAVVPLTSSKANDIWRIDVKKEKPGRFHGQNHIWHKGNNSIYWIKQFDHDKMIMMEPTFYFFDSSFRLIKRIDARSGIWKDGVWQIRKGITQDLEKDGGYSMSRFKQLELALPENPEDFVRVEREPEEMGYQQLKRFAKRLRAEGYDATKYFVDINIKIAFPFVILIMALIGVPVALWKKEMSTPVAVSLGIVLCFAYLLILGLSRTLGFAGILPPVFSAWLANSVFFFLGIYLMINANR
ncbi:MAG TPA: LPS export ABC transporter permease LptG [Deltaproteobacteria bacterium]|nr:LPS export ABC transporter permease LptG [Deltaproteobacteria bacterium]